MKWFRKNRHCLFVEDEIYNWAPQPSRSGRRLLLVSILVVSSVVLLMLLGGR
ncbi:MAG: hypothetical protein WD772_13025 [Pseudohongiellaceae bacterium]